jgi:CDP-diacylglycerol--serine O-phosphatidyltransferase
MTLRRLHFEPPIQLLPNLFTAANFALGVRAITLVLRGDQMYDHAALCIMLAMLCDVFDGMVARLTHSTSAFGKEFDSLADLVSFGVAPAVMVYSQSLVVYDGVEWKGFGQFGFLICAIYAGCAALRLARFNAHADAEQRAFVGLPSPAAAGVIASYFMLLDTVAMPAIVVQVITRWILPVATAVIGVLMVSTVRYPAPAKTLLKRQHSFYIFAAIACVIALLIANRGATLFVLFTGYMLLGIVRQCRKWFGTHHPTYPHPHGVQPSSS